MQHTTNYDLPQWEATDAVRREDFNAAMATLDAAVAGAAGGCRLETFTYVGTGTYGQQNPTVLTFSAVPLMFFVLGDVTALCGYAEKAFIFTQKPGLSAEMVVFLNSWSGSSVSFYSSDYAERQVNKEGITYTVVALHA